MSMTQVQLNVVTELQKIAAELISIRGRLTMITEMWGNEGVANLVDADFQENGVTAHVTQVELAAAAAALVAINTTLGTGAASNASKLLKIVNVVPR